MSKLAPTSAEIECAWDTLKAAVQCDPDYAWALHCNLAVPIMDTTCAGHASANMAGAYLMSYLFDHDITKHQNYIYGKSGAQLHHELRKELGA